MFGPQRRISLREIYVWALLGFPRRGKFPAGLFFVLSLPLITFRLVVRLFDRFSFRCVFRSRSFGARHPVPAALETNVTRQNESDWSENCKKSFYCLVGMKLSLFYALLVYPELYPWRLQNGIVMKNIQYYIEVLKKHIDENVRISIAILARIRGPCLGCSIFSIDDYVVVCVVDLLSNCERLYSGTAPWPRNALRIETYK